MKATLRLPQRATYADYLAAEQDSPTRHEFIDGVIVASALGALSEVWSELQRAAGAAERLFELLDTRPIIAAPASPQALPSPARRAYASLAMVPRYSVASATTGSRRAALRAGR